VAASKLHPKPFAEHEERPCAVVLDNTPFHTAVAVREGEENWETRGLVLSRLAGYLVVRITSISLFPKRSLDYALRLQA